MIEWRTVDGIQLIDVSRLFQLLLSLMLYELKPSYVAQCSLRQVRRLRHISRIQKARDLPPISGLAGGIYPPISGFTPGGRLLVPISARP